jgi:hypothetical protein
MFVSSVKISTDLLFCVVDQAVPLVIEPRAPNHVVTPERQKSQHKNQTPVNYTMGTTREGKPFSDAPADVYFKATTAVKSVRKQAESSAIRRAARCPWRLFKLQ